MNGISFRRLKVLIKAHGYSIQGFAKECGVSPNRISMICNDVSIPKTDFVAKMCSILKLYPSEIVCFDGIKLNEKYFNDDMKQPLPKEAVGDVTYQPLFMFLVDYLADYNFDHDTNKTENDLFNQIEPPRRLKGYESCVKDYAQKSVEARFGKGYVSKSKKRTDYTKGLPSATRTKLRNDRPLNLAVIYEICKKLGCPVDFVMGYK